MKKNKWIYGLIIINIFSMCFISNESYASVGKIETQQENKLTNIQNTIVHSPNGDLNKVINVDDPYNVTFDSSVVDEADGWINLKASQIIKIIQTIGCWVSFAVFVICGLKTVVGVFGKSDKVGEGVMGMIIAAICFVVIQYADIVFQYLLKFITQ